MIKIGVTLMEHGNDKIYSYDKAGFTERKEHLIL